MKKIKLCAFINGPGHHLASWRHSKSQADGRLNFDHLKKMAQIAEGSFFDALFLADGLALPHRPNAEGRNPFSFGFEPVTLFSALAAITSKIGLITTASTSYESPFHVARKFASLDYLSSGRAGCNFVTTWGVEAAGNFGIEKHPVHEIRYAQAQEFYEIVTQLWDSWSDSAPLYDKENGFIYDPKKVREINYIGKFLSVRGPLNIPRPVQGYPVVVQAGASAEGKAFAARMAEVIFTAQPDFLKAQAFYKETKLSVKGIGRNPDATIIMPGVFTVVGESDSEAKEKYQELQELILPEVGMGLLHSLTGVDLRGVPIDSELPDLPQTNMNKSRQSMIIEMAKKEKLTLKQLYTRLACGRGHYDVVGSVKHIADELEHWFSEGAADGFNVMPAVLPGGLQDFCTLVIPELQKRNLFRTEYQGNTLRDHLGLSKPINQFER